MEFCNGNTIRNIENAVINAFFEAELMGTPKEQFFKLDERNFMTSFNKKIVRRINECIEQNKSISLVAHLIYEKCAGTMYEDEILEITAQNPLPMFVAKDYHDCLAKKRIERSLNVA